jgi:hypothetical protein
VPLLASISCSVDFVKFNVLGNRGGSYPGQIVGLI